MAPLNDSQLTFWRALLAPFADHELSATRRGGKELTYIDSRSLFNRLDSVCGPHGWDIEYRPTDRGYTCRVGILVPVGGVGTGVWMYKEDGAGFEEMGQKNKDTGEFEYDVDNDEKSGYTNAARRCIQNAWGIGRYLYKKGIPTFLDPNAGATNSVAQSEPRSPAADRRPDSTPADAPPAADANKSKPFNNFKIPKPGKSVWAWAKEMEKVFETLITKGMGNKGDELGYGSMFAEWNEAQVNDICLDAIAHLATMPKYSGQFDHLLTGTQSARPAPAPAAQAEDSKPIRKELAAKLTALVEFQTGKQATAAELKPALAIVSSGAITGRGVTGEICESLAKCEDATWIRNMIAVAEQMIATSARPAVDDDVDF